MEKPSKSIKDILTYFHNKGFDEIRIKIDSKVDVFDIEKSLKQGYLIVKEVVSNDKKT